MLFEHMHARLLALTDYHDQVLVMRAFHNLIQSGCNIIVIGSRYQTEC